MNQQKVKKTSNKKDPRDGSIMVPVRLAVGVIPAGVLPVGVHFTDQGKA